jgi:prevent-host-death family protein
MNIPITEAKAQLTELVRRAEAGEEIVLTRHGRPAVQLKAIDQPRRSWTPEEREARYRFLKEISEKASKEALPGPDAAHSADFLYDHDGMPA